MPRLPVYEEQGVQQGGTVKLSGSDPVAGALQGLGQSISQVGGMLGDVQSLIDRGEESGAKASEAEAIAGFEKEFNDGLLMRARAVAEGGDTSVADLTSEFIPENKAAWMESKMAGWEQGVKENWRGSKRSLNMFFDDYRARSAHRRVQLNADTVKFQMERAVVEIQSNADAVRKEAFYLDTIGQTEAAEVKHAEADGIYISLEPFIGKGMADEYSRQGFYSATETAIRQSATIAAVDAHVEKAAKNKNRYSNAQYSAIQSAAESQRSSLRRDTAEFVGKLVEAANRGENIESEHNDNRDLIELNLGPEVNETLDNIRKSQRVKEAIKDPAVLEQVEREAEDAIKSQFPELAKEAERLSGMMMTVKAAELGGFLKRVNASSAPEEYKLALIGMVMDDQSKRIGKISAGGLWFTRARKADDLFNYLRYVTETAVRASGTTAPYSRFADVWVQLADILRSGKVPNADESLSFEANAKAWIAAELKPTVDAADASATSMFLLDKFSPGQIVRQSGQRGLPKKPQARTKTDEELANELWGK